MSRPPVTDWATDFDHLDPAFVQLTLLITSRLNDGASHSGTIP